MKKLLLLILVIPALTALLLSNPGTAQTLHPAIWSKSVDNAYGLVKHDDVWAGMRCYPMTPAPFADWALPPDVDSVGFYLKFEGPVEATILCGVEQNYNLALELDRLVGTEGPKLYTYAVPKGQGWVGITLNTNRINGRANKWGVYVDVDFVTATHRRNSANVTGKDSVKTAKPKKFIDLFGRPAKPANIYKLLPNGTALVLSN